MLIIYVFTSWKTMINEIGQKVAHDELTNEWSNSDVTMKIWYKLKPARAVFVKFGQEVALEELSHLKLA